MKPLQLLSSLAILTSLAYACASRNSSRDGEQKRKPAITGVTPTIKNPSRGVINASGDGLTPGIGRSNGAGSEENAANIANNAIAKANVGVKISQNNLSSLSDEALIGRISARQESMEKTSSEILKVTRNEQIKRYAEMMVNEYGQVKNQLKKLSAVKSISLSSASQEKTTSAAGKSDFDYVQKTIEDQQYMVLLFTVASQSKDTGIREFGIKYLPLVKKQLEDARELTRVVTPKQKS